MNLEYESFLVDLVRENPKIKPARGYELFIRNFSDTGGENFPSSKQVKSKISSLKHAAKRREGSR